MLNDVLLPFYYCWGYSIHFLRFHTIFSFLFLSRSPFPSFSISIFIYFLFHTDDALPLLLLLVFIFFFFLRFSSFSQNEFYENIIEMKILHAQFTYINRCLIRLHVRNSYSQSDFPRQKTEKSCIICWTRIQCEKSVCVFVCMLYGKQWARASECGTPGTDRNDNGREILRELKFLNNEIIIFKWRIFFTNAISFGVCQNRVERKWEPGRTSESACVQTECTMRLLNFNCWKIHQNLFSFILCEKFRTCSHFPISLSRSPSPSLALSFSIKRVYLFWKYNQFYLHGECRL